MTAELLFGLFGKVRYRDVGGEHSIVCRKVFSSREDAEAYIPQFIHGIGSKEDNAKRPLALCPNPKVSVIELDAERAAHDSSEQTIREQCAKIAESYPVGGMAPYAETLRATIAAAIRSGA